MNQGYIPPSHEPEGRDPFKIVRRSRRPVWLNLALLVLVLLVVYLVFYAGGDDESPNLPDASGTPGDQGRETPLREEFDVIPPTPGHPADTGSQVGIPRPEAEALA